MMKRLVGTLTILTLCAGTAWAQSIATGPEYEACTDRALGASGQPGAESDADGYFILGRDGGITLAVHNPVADIGPAWASSGATGGKASGYNNGWPPDYTGHHWAQADDFVLPGTAADVYQITLLSFIGGTELDGVVDTYRISVYADDGSGKPTAWTSPLFRYEEVRGSLNRISETVTDHDGTFCRWLYEVTLDTSDLALSLNGGTTYYLSIEGDVENTEEEACNYPTYWQRFYWLGMSLFNPNGSTDINGNRWWDVDELNDGNWLGWTGDNAGDFIWAIQGVRDYESTFDVTQADFSLYGFSTGGPPVGTPTTGPDNLDVSNINGTYDLDIPPAGTSWHVWLKGSMDFDFDQDGSWDALATFDDYLGELTSPGPSTSWGPGPIPIIVEYEGQSLDLILGYDINVDGSYPSGSFGGNAFANFTISGDSSNMLLLNGGLTYYDNLYGGGDGIIDGCLQSDLSIICTSEYGKLVLEAADCQDDLYGETGKQIEVELWMRDLTQDVTGYLAFLEYDTAKLTYEDTLSSYTNSPFGDHLTTIDEADYDDGKLQLDGSTYTPTSGDALLATLVFTVVNECVTAGVDFDLDAAFDSELSFEGVPVPTALDDSPHVYLDDTDPTFTVPGPVDVECHEWLDYKMHAPQWPDPTGWDVNATFPLVLADDWLCTETGPVKDIHFWGSWKNGVVDEIVSISLSIHDNVVGPPSHPGNLLWEYMTSEFTVVPVESGEYQGWYDPHLPEYFPNDHHNYFLYSVVIPDGSEYTQVEGTIYWLDISVVTEGGIWGWKTALKQWNDDAVWGILPDPTWEPLFDPEWPEESLDLAFVITDGAGFYTGVPTDVHDNCEPPEPTVTYVDTIVQSVPCPNAFTITRTWTVTDDCGNWTSQDQIISVVDTTPPTITGPTVNGGDVDEDCEFTVTFSAQVDDNCCVNVADVVVGVSETTGNATLGTPTINKVQVGSTHVDITGSVLVSALTGCPATVQVTINANDCCGNPAAAQASATADVNDVTLPEITCPADIVENADAGVCTLTVAPFTWATATDNCDPAPDITWVRSDGAGTLTDPYDSADSPITITWTATDACGLIDTCDQTVTVDAVNDVDLTIQLADVNESSTTRCIHFVTDDCSYTDVALTFTNGSFTGTVEIPCGDWDFLCAKDEQHTHWDDSTLTDDGATYSADSTLVLDPGDTDNDADVDINDVTWLIYQYGQAAADGGCPWDDTRDADFSNNGTVSSEDYTILSAYWLTTSDCPCGPFLGGNPPAVKLSGEDLRSLSADVVAAVDLNADGVIDHRDVRLFEQSHGLPHTLSETIRATAEEAQPAGVGGLRRP